MNRQRPLFVFDVTLWSGVERPAQKLTRTKATLSMKAKIIAEHSALPAIASTVFSFLSANESA
ncbi:MAG: hypothetical protein QOF48_3700 [Verrucomicrobiota bacterium]|jgi:hypothetical protein